MLGWLWFCYVTQCVTYILLNAALCFIYSSGSGTALMFASFTFSLSFTVSLLHSELYAFLYLLCDDWKDDSKLDV